MKCALLLFFLCCFALLRAETAADKIAAGRAALAARDLPTAKVRFQEALALNPQSQVATALLGFTRGLGILKLPAVQAAFDRAGVVVTERPGYTWSAEMTYDAQNHIVIAPDYNTSEVATLIRATVIPELERIRADFAGVTNEGFLLTLSAAEVGVPAALNVDYADLLMARAWLRLAECFFHSGTGQNWDANLGAVQSLLGGRALTLQRLLLDNPDLLKPGPTAERTAARAALLDAIQLYRRASIAIHARPTGVSRLFVIDPAQVEEEADFEAGLAKAERSLNEFVSLESSEKMDLRLGAVFAPDWSLRASLPAFSPTGFDYATLTDATFGGALIGLTREAFANVLTTEPETVPELGWEWVTPKPGGNDLHAYLALEGGKHLVVGAAGTILTSENGTIWSARTLAGRTTQRGVAVGAGKRVMIGKDGILVSSDQGLTWNNALTSSFYRQPTSIIFAAGKFVVANGDWLFSTSTDGVTWTYSVVDDYPHLHGLMHTGTMFVAAGEGPSDGKAAIYTSSDAVTWVRRYTGAGANTVVKRLAQGGGKFVAVGPGGQCAVSSDGLAWNAVTMPTTANLNDVGYRNGRFVAVGDAGTLLTSADGTSWTTISSGQTAPLLGVGAGSDQIYVTGSSGVILRSTDGITFTRTLPASAAVPAATTLLSLRAIGSQLYAVGTGGAIWRSADGQTFSAVSSGTTNSLWSIVSQGGTLCAVGDGGTILSSTDGTLWSARTSGTTANLRSIAYLNGEFVVVGAAGTVLTSLDGVAWAARNTGVTATLYDVAHGNGRYVAVGDFQSAVSTDRVVWTVVNTASLRSVVFADGAFTTVGLSGIRNRSVDGLVWKGLGNYYVDPDAVFVRVLGGRYCSLRRAHDYNSDFAQTSLALSVDGEHWVGFALGTASTHYAAEYFQGRFYTAGAGGQILRSAPLPPPAGPTLRSVTPDTLLAQGDTLALVVAPNGEGTLAYQWKKNDAILPGATSPTLSLTNAQASDAGSYKLTATNSFGSATSPAIVVTVDATPVAPKIVAPPQSQTVNVGLPVSLSVVATGTAPLSYVWKKNGVELPASTTATLTLSAVQPASAGTYSVVVTNLAGSATSPGAVLTVDSNPVYVFSTLAGEVGEPRAGAVVDGTGPAARFFGAASVAVDPQGNVYTADYYGQTVRKITPAGVVTTVAGQALTVGTADGAGIAARFSYPRAVALDSAGENLYVSDSTLRKVNLATRMVTTVPGVFPVTSALVVDPAGTIFFLSDQHAIYRYSSGGTLSIFAGSPGNVGYVDGIGLASRFNYPRGLALDAAGHLYVADSGNYCIRKIAPDGTVTTFAGRPGIPSALVDGPLAQATFYYPLGIAVDAQGGVFVGEGFQNLIRKISAGAVRTIGGHIGTWQSADGVGTAAALYSPRGLAVDTAGNLYFAEEWTNLIRKGTPSASPLAPAIVTTATNQLSLTGGNATFTVAVAGLAPFSYQWKKDGTDLAGATNATLSLSNLSLAQAGAYAVRVTNAHGTALSPAAALSVMTPPSIAVQPPPRINVPVGQPVLLTVTAAGSGPLTYQWSRNGTSIIEATSASYSIPVAAVGDSGSYTVLVANAGGSVTSAAAAVFAHVAPTLANLPVAQTVNTGATATFTVGASGSPSPVFQWRRNGVPLLGATMSTLTLTNVQPAEAGTYSITVSNAGGSIISPGVDLTVVLPAAAPAITAQPLNSSATAGHSVALSVSAVGNATLLYQWRKNGTSIDGATAAALNFTSVQLADAATYSVVVTNGAGGATSRDAVLSVVPATFGAVHTATGRGYVAGKTARITTTISYSGVLTGLSCQVLLPSGWSFVSGDSATAMSSPAVGAVDVLEWDWSAVPASPVTLTYLVNVPLAMTGVQSLSSLVTARPGPIQFLAKTDPLILASVALHSGDTDGDFSLGLFELTRVIELYNTRRDTTRTGAYVVATTATEDGFTPDSERTGSASTPLTRYHSADTNRDGRLSLTELTRVIELFNTRSGTSRTGAYHAATSPTATEDGFAPGP